jgi:hypothetical protein
VLVKAEKCGKFGLSFEVERSHGEIKAAARKGKEGMLR